MLAIKQEVTVQANGLIEVRSPELHEGDVAEVILLIRPGPNTSSLAAEDVDQLTDWRQFAGIFHGDHGTVDNESIDHDLAAEYGSTHEPEK